MNSGRIVRVISNSYTVLSNDKLFICKPRGKFRNDNIVPMVGDIVKFTDENYLMEIEKRKTELVRPFISNVDQAFIITSAKSPDFSANLLDKLLIVIEYNNVEPVICFTKIDLLEDTHEIENIINYYKKIGYQVLKNTEIDKIKEQFKDRITVFTGQTGAGKSTLLNRLDDELNINTAEISKALGRGKHTTRHVELYQILGGLVADTPGFSAISFKDMKKSDIRDNFIEFNEYKEFCKYRDCMHDKEDGCYIKEKVADKTILESRYIDYLKFINGSD